MTGLRPVDGWTSRFAELESLNADDRRFLESRARTMHFEAGRRVFEPGRKPDAFLLLLDGTVRVQQVAETGREIVLFRVAAGESCVMTTACLLSNEDYQAEGITESPVTALALARKDFDELTARSGAFRELVFARYASRMTRLMAVLEDVAFQRLDKRLAAKLVELADASGSVRATHHELATELGTAREVVSRQLKALMAKGLLTASRRRIDIVDRAALARLASDA